jgi:hypothetical protein
LCAGKPLFFTIAEPCPDSCHLSPTLGWLGILADKFGHFVLFIHDVITDVISIKY